MGQPDPNAGDLAQQSPAPGAPLPLQALGEEVLAALYRLEYAFVRRDVRRQLKMSRCAVVPLFALGTEWDLPGLWSVAEALDPGLGSQRLPMDERADTALLESAIDRVSALVLSYLRPRAALRYPAYHFEGGMLEGVWAFYAVIPKESAFPHEMPSQALLFRASDRVPSAGEGAGASHPATHGATHLREGETNVYEG